MITQSDLDQFTGTEQYYQHMLVKDMYCTDGVHYLATEAGAYWLIDLIASYQHVPEVAAEPFQVWTLKLHGDGQALAYMQRDSGEPHIVEQEIPFTDFPEALGPEFQLWLEFGSIDGTRAAKVLLLPSEH